MRRRSSLAALAAVLVLVASGCRWPEFRFGAERTANNTDETAIGLANVDDLQVTFTASIDPFSRAPLAVSNGSVFVVERNGVLSAFDAAGTAKCTTGAGVRTCDPKWTAPLAGTSGSSPAVANDVVYVSSDVFVSIPFPPTLDGRLQAFSAAGTTGCTGTPKVCSPLWTTPDLDSFSFAPTVLDGRVYRGGNGIIAFDEAATAGCSGTPKVCSPLWFTGGSLGSTPAIGAGRAFYFTGAGLEAYDLAGCNAGTGCTRKWTAFVDRRAELGANDTAPALGPSDVVIGHKTGISAFRRTPTPIQCPAGTCTARWTATIGEVTGSVAIAGGVVYASTGTNLFALNLTNGAVLWSAPLGGSGTDPTVANGVVYVGSTSGKVLAFDAAGTQGCSGTPKVCTAVTSIDLGSPVNAPVVANGRLYTTTDAGALFGLELPAPPA